MKILKDRDNELLNRLKFNAPQDIKMRDTHSKILEKSIDHLCAITLPLPPTRCSERGKQFSLYQTEIKPNLHWYSA